MRISKLVVAALLALPAGASSGSVPTLRPAPIEAQSVILAADIALQIEKLRVLESADYVTGIGWSPDGRLLATYSDNGASISLWSAAGGRLKLLDRHGGYGPNYSTSIGFLDGGRQLLTPEANNRSGGGGRLAFALWDVDSGRIVRNIEGPAPDESGRFNHVWDYVVSADGKLVAFLTGQANDPVTVYATREWTTLLRIPVVGPNSPVDTAMALALSPDGKLLAIGLISGKVALVDLNHPQESPRTIVVYPSKFLLSVDALAFSPDGRSLATGSSGRMGRDAWKNDTADQALKLAPIKVWSMADTELLASYPGGAMAPIRQLSWSGDGRFLAVAASDRTAKIVTPADPSAPITAIPFDAPVFSVNFAPEGNSLAVAAGTSVTIFGVAL
jgi:WD40 repeat protein